MKKKKKIEELYSLDSDIDHILQTAIPDDWPELNELLYNFKKKPYPREIYLPLASCLAVCGDETKAVHVSASFYMLCLFFRMYEVSKSNDCFTMLAASSGNQALAYNYASALHILPLKILELSPLPVKVIKRIKNCFLNCLFLIAREKEIELMYLSANTKPQDFSDNSILEVKIIASACTAGALAGTEDKGLITACARFGFHLGKALHTFYKLEVFSERSKDISSSYSGIKNDVQSKKPLLAEVKDQLKIQKIKNDQKVNNDSINILYNKALEEWQIAQHAISVCPHSKGKDILNSWITTEIIDSEKNIKQF